MSHANIWAKGFLDKRPANAKAVRPNMLGIMAEPQGRPRGRKEVSKRKGSRRRCRQRQIT